MGIRNIDKGFPSTVKTYATEANCEKAVREVASKITGMCNARIVPVVGDKGITIGDVRYTAYFFGFDTLSDALFVAWRGFVVHN